MAQPQPGVSGSSASAAVVNRGRTVTLAGFGINLALGILYTWSVLSAAIAKQPWGWTEADRSLPYSIALLVNAFTMIPGGRMQDTIGPRRTATLGGVLVGLGFILASLSTSVVGYVVGFGVFVGAGIGFAVSSCTPPAIKWFDRSRTGLIAGIVVSGFGLASVYAAPMAQLLSDTYGVPTTLRIIGAVFLIIVVGLAQLLEAPPAGYVPPAPDRAATKAGLQVAAPRREFRPGEALRCPQFWLLWLMYAFAAGAGLMVIGKMAPIAEGQVGLSLGFLLVAILAVGNGGGRVGLGWLSDRIGRFRTLLTCFLLQAVLLVLLSQTVKGSLLANGVALGLMAMLIGANYGANLAVFPAITKDWFGLKHYGMNYGFLYTAWGIGGFVMSLVAGATWDPVAKTFGAAYFLAAALLVAAAVLSQVVKPPRQA